MSDTPKKCVAQETAACCCVNVGTIMDNSDCSTTLNQTFAQRQEAEQALAALINKARSVESEPCVIDSHIEELAGEVQLSAKFTFSCQAEALIFQLGLR